MKKIYFVLLFVALSLGFASCSKDDDTDSTKPSDTTTVAKNPFDTVSINSTSDRDKIIIISDLHLGNDLSYSENVKHLKRLEEFLKEVRTSSTVKELVIGGDMFDEWYIPTRTDTYGTGSQADFIRKTVAANQSIFDALNGIIKDGKIKLTYIPGNHDMGFTRESIDIAMPGVNQARDSEQKFGIGTYHPDGYTQIAIEHGHRYDFFSSLTPNANESDAPGATLPPGYFFARIAANSFTDPTTIEASTKVPKVILKDSSNSEQYSKYVYYNIWKTVMEGVVYVKDNFSDPIIKTNVGKYTKTYAIKDILPYNSSNDGSIQMNLYNGLFTQNSWNERQKYNNVIVMNSINDAIVGSLKTAYIDKQSNVQYFLNPLSSIRLVVFGHTHLPMIKTYTNLNGDTCIYANSGTWEDQKTRNKSAAIEQDTIKMHFVMIAPTKSNKKRLDISLYQFRYGKHLLVSRKELGL